MKIALLVVTCAARAPAGLPAGSGASEKAGPATTERMIAKLNLHRRIQAPTQQLRCHVVLTGTLRCQDFYPVTPKIFGGLRVKPGAHLFRVVLTSHQSKGEY